MDNTLRQDLDMLKAAREAGSKRVFKRMEQLILQNLADKRDDTHELDE